MRILRLLVLAAGVGAALLALASGPGVRAGLWTWQAGFGLMRIATYVGLAAAAAALVVLLIPRVRSGHAAMIAAALVLGLGAAAPALGLLYQAKRLPSIHDITTDTGEPPAFVALAEARRQAPNGLDYRGAELAAQQKQGYPDIAPLTVGVAFPQAFERALAAAREMGWEIVASDAAAGRIEATATTFWFGFKDDVVIRLRPDPRGTRVDVRSMSRVGRSDVGANARRIRQYLSRLGEPG